MGKKSACLIFHVWRYEGLFPFCHDLFNAFQRKERFGCFQYTASNFFINKSVQTKRQKVLLVIVWLVYIILCFYFYYLVMQWFTGLNEEVNASKIFFLLLVIMDCRLQSKVLWTPSQRHTMIRSSFRWCDRKKTMVFSPLRASQSVPQHT